MFRVSNKDTYFQVGRIVDVLKNTASHHNGFPVVDNVPQTSAVRTSIALSLTFTVANLKQEKVLFQVQ